MSFQKVFARLALLVAVSIILAGCSTTAESEATASAEKSTPASSATATQTATSTATTSPTPTPSPTLTPTPTPSITPTTVDSLRARVIIDNRLACRFGPGAPYLFKFSFAATANIELVGRMEHSDWLLAQAIGGDNRCWVNGGADYLQIDGNPMALPIVDPHVVLAWSPYYGPMTVTEVMRDEDTVTISYSGLRLREGDDSEQTPYVLEAWVCQDGEFVFIALGSYGFAIQVEDEAGCEEDSHAQVGAAEKHGYTPWTEVDWPPHLDSTPNP